MTYRPALRTISFFFLIRSGVGRASIARDMVNGIWRELCRECTGTRVMRDWRGKEINSHPDRIRGTGGLISNHRMRLRDKVAPRGAYPTRPASAIGARAPPISCHVLAWPPLAGIRRPSGLTI